MAEEKETKKKPVEEKAVIVEVPTQTAPAFKLPGIEEPLAFEQVILELYNDVHAIKKSLL